MTQLPLVEMAQQGDEWAIATLLNQKLKTTGCTARVQLEDACLKVLVAAIEPPNQRSTVALVRNVLQRLSVNWVETIAISGKATDDPTPLWTETFTLERTENEERKTKDGGRRTDDEGRKTEGERRNPQLSTAYPLPPTPHTLPPTPHTPTPKFIPPSTSTDFLMLGFMAFLTVYAISGLTAEDYSGAFVFLHGVDLIIHEAGHFLFSISRIVGETFLGELIYFAGGSLLQIIVPAVIVGNFVLTAQYYSAAVALYWVAQNFTDVAIYIKDASAMELPLLAEGLIHDWNYILGALNLLEADQAIGGFVHFIGVLLFIASILFGVFCVIGQRFLQPSRSSIHS